jgi:membrane protease YdiL (CAAX protease family)
MTELPESPVPRPEAESSTIIPPAVVPGAGMVPAQKSLPERIFLGPDGVRLGWRLLLYIGLAAVIVFLLDWLGDPIFAHSHGATRLWEELYGECVLLLGVFLPAVLLARIEHRPVDDYGLPRTQAFGRWFWTGVVWGFAAITALLLVMRGIGVYEFGGPALHGVRIVRFAVFWALFFLVVGLTEEFAVRGYVLFTLGRAFSFWPAAVLLSLLFGAIHLSNRGETFAGALGAAIIGLFFCLTLRRTGSLWFAVGFHASWDWGETYFYGVPDSGTIEPGHLLTPTLHGKAWLSGGTVGPEASVLLLPVLAVTWWLFHRQYRAARYLSETPAAALPGISAAAEPSRR